MIKPEKVIVSEVTAPKAPKHEVIKPEVIDDGPTILNPNKAEDPEDPKSVKEAEARSAYKKNIAN